MGTPLGASNSAVGRAMALAPFWSHGRRGVRALGCSLGCALQHFFSLPGITEEVQFSGEQLDLHTHGLILLTVDAKSASCSLGERRAVRTSPTPTVTHPAVQVCPRSSRLEKITLPKHSARTQRGLWKSPSSTLQGKGVLFFLDLFPPTPQSWGFNNSIFKHLTKIHTFQGFSSSFLALISLKQDN